MSSPLGLKITILVRVMMDLRAGIAKNSLDEKHGGHIININRKIIVLKRVKKSSKVINYFGKKFNFMIILYYHTTGRV